MQPTLGGKETEYVLTPQIDNVHIHTWTEPLFSNFFFFLGGMDLDPPLNLRQQTIAAAGSWVPWPGRSFPGRIWGVLVFCWVAIHHWVYIVWLTLVTFVLVKKLPCFSNVLTISSFPTLCHETSSKTSMRWKHLWEILIICSSTVMHSRGSEISRRFPLVLNHWYLQSFNIILNKSSFPNRLGPLKINKKSCCCYLHHRTYKIIVYHSFYI